MWSRDWCRVHYETRGFDKDFTLSVNLGKWFGGVGSIICVLSEWAMGQPYLIHGIARQRKEQSMQMFSTNNINWNCGQLKKLLPLKNIFKTNQKSNADPSNQEHKNQDVKNWHAQQNEK